MKLYNHWCNFYIGDNTVPIVKHNRGKWRELLEDAKLDLEKDLLWIQDTIKNAKYISGGIEESDFDLVDFTYPKNYKCDICGEKTDEFTFKSPFRQNSIRGDGNYALVEKECYLCENCRNRIANIMKK